MTVHSYAEHAQSLKSLRMLTVNDAMQYLEQADKTIEELYYRLERAKKFIPAELGYAHEEINQTLAKVQGEDNGQ